jgi:hypothetical protein
MGLAERRAAKAFQDEAYPALLERIEQAAACPVAVSVDWASLQTEAMRTSTPKHGPRCISSH